MLLPVAGGGLSLRRRTQPWAREETRSVVADTEGNLGYGAYLLPFLRGMFDLWTLLLLEQSKVARFLKRASRRRFVRVLVKPTDMYVEELDRLFLSPGRSSAVPARGRSRFSREEWAQLHRFDVPYFFRQAQGGPLLHLAPPPEPFGRKRAGRQRFLEPYPPPSRRVLDGGQITLGNLGVAVRDAVTFVLDDVPHRVAEDPRGGVRIELRDAQRGAVSFDWREVGQRLTYSWSRRGLRVSMEPLETHATE